MGGPDAAAVLDVDVDGLEDGLDGSRVLPVAVEGAVEVDEVQGPGPGGNPLLGCIDGVAVGRAGAAAVVVGTALYEGAFTLADANAI